MCGMEAEIRVIINKTKAYMYVSCVYLCVYNKHTYLLLKMKSNM